MWSNSSWNLIYPEAHVSHLPRTHSDHCPILLSTAPNIGPPSPRPFRFESVWFSDPSVFLVIEDSWSAPSPSFAFTTNLFANKITTWNKENFGNIFHKKKRLLARLSGTQKALDLNPKKFLSDLEQTLISDFNKILILEEEFWALKSRVNWLSDGDRNTRFFHLTTLGHRRANKIRALKDSSGVWQYEDSIIKEVLTSHFQNLFTTEFFSSTSLVHPPFLFSQSGYGYPPFFMLYSFYG